MDLNLKSRQNISTKLLEDIANYQRLLQRTDLENDIPPRRYSGTVTVKPKAQRDLSEKKKKPMTKKSRAESPVLLLQRPTFTGKPMVEHPNPKPKAPTRQTRRQARIVQKKKDQDDCLRKVNKFVLRKHKTLLWLNAVNASNHSSSFQQRVLTRHTYEQMIKCIRERVDDIDFGLLSRFLPKNLELESQRFHIDYPADYEQLYSRGSVFSDDIDQFFKQLSGSIPKSDPSFIPLV